MNPFNAIALSYSVSEDVFHSETMLEFVTASQNDIFRRMPARYSLIGVFTSENEATEYMMTFRAKLIEAKIGVPGHVYEDQPEGANQIAD